MGSVLRVDSWLLAALCVLPVGSIACAGPPPQQIAFFESRIRPVLVEHCYSCHNSADTAEAGLAVDHRRGLREGGDGGELFSPGDAKESRLLAILKHEIDGLEMPQDGPKLDDRVVADFEKWISMGAPDPRDEPPSLESLSESTSWPATLQRRKRWWSFQPIAARPLPQPADWSDHPIDRLVLEKLAEVGLTPTHPADPAVLIRRLHVNLIGLPPRPDEFYDWIGRYEAAGNDGRDRVTEQLIDHLLASEHFGERWARHWMDWIRYAESHGSEGDPRIDNAWMYRDYLIRALNADVPYDQLVREHVAGDLLSDPRINEDLGINESIVGPVHWRMVFHGFAPTDALDEKVRFVDDQINAFSKAFLGLTVSCARCHDHKFDAISQQDYYAIFGILASCRPARSVIDLPHRQNHGRETLMRWKPKIRAAIAHDWLNSAESLKQRILADDFTKNAEKPDHPLHPLFQLRQKVSQGSPFAKAWNEVTQGWTESRRSADPEGVLQHWNLADQDDYLQWFTDGIGLRQQPQPAGEFAVAAEGDAAIMGIYPAGIYSHTLSSKHPARLTSTDFDVVENSELWVRALGDREASLRYVVQDYPRNGTVYPVTQLKPNWNWQRYDLAYWKGDQIHLELTADKDAPLLVGSEDRSWFGVTEAKLVRKGTPPPKTESPLVALLLSRGDEDAPGSAGELAEYLAGSIVTAVEDWQSGKATDRQAELLDVCIRSGLLPNRLQQLPTAKPLIEDYRRVEAEIPPLRRVPGLDETTGRTQSLFVRGNHKNPAEEVPRRFLEAIDPTPYRGSDSGRLRLANDLLRDDNPLTRRVIVNRIWHHLFGRGIVATPDNFGRLGQRPSHPELLDWLAARLVEDGWSLKKAIRLIVTSKTWQLSPHASEDAAEKDPENIYLSRANVRRMEAEVIRDSLLSVSGRLNRDLFGNPVDGNSPRRSIYVRVIRNSLDAFLRAFDFPEPFSATGRRDVTNVPAQSLTMMNDPRVSEYASAFAAKLLDDPSLRDDESRIEKMFVIGLSRRPADHEVRKAKEYLAATKQAHQQLLRQAEGIRLEISARQSKLASILDPVRSRLVDSASDQGTSQLPKPIGRWDFAKGLNDLVGKADGIAKGGASTGDGALVVKNGGHVVTAPIDYPLKEKTLEAWVRLDHLGQRGGGVMTVQTINGAVFDSIVFAEQAAQQWLAGSDHFKRTRPFQGTEEGEATERFVHVAIVYHADGRVIGYRDGKPYGKPYKSNGPVEFKPGQAVISFGVRHLPAGGNRLLAGKIREANLYSRALSAEEIAASARGGGVYVSQKQVIDALSPQEQSQVKTLRAEIQQLQSQVESLGSVPDSLGRQEVWTDLTRALITFKEFIYVR